MITLEDLENYYSMAANEQAIQNEIDALYKTVVHSPNLDGMPHGSGTSDPTAKAVEHKMELEEKLREKHGELVAKREEINDWLGNVEDDKIEAIVRLRYLQRHSWKYVAEHVYGYASDNTPQMAVTRYFNKLKV